MNSTGVTASEMARTLQRLTSVLGLDALTMAPCGDTLAQRSLISAHLKWCAICFEESRAVGEQLWHPLLWQLSAVEACPKHNVMLVQRCPKCDARLTPLMRYSRVGCCAKCSTSLGVSPDKRRVMPSQWHLSAASEAVRFIERLQQHGIRASNFSTNVSTIIKSMFNGEVSAFSRCVGAHHSTVSAWTTGEQRPSFPSLLAVSTSCGVDAYELLTSMIEVRAQAPMSALRSTTSRVNKSALNKHDLGEVRVVLEDALVNEATFRESLTKICRRVGVHPSFVMRKLPDLAAKIKTRYQLFLTARKEARHFFTKWVVEAKIMDLYYAGHYPSQRQVNNQLQHGMSLRDPIAKAVWRETIAELGISGMHAGRAVNSIK
jgi:hypothetical protein